MHLTTEVCRRSGVWLVTLGCLTLPACAMSQDPGYADGVAWAESVLELGDPALLEGNDNDLFRQGVCEPQSYTAPEGEQEAFMSGCMETLRNAS